MVAKVCNYARQSSTLMEISLLNICYKIDVNITLEHHDKPFKMEVEQHKVCHQWGKWWEPPWKKMRINKGVVVGVFQHMLGLCKATFTLDMIVQKM